MPFPWGTGAIRLLASDVLHLPLLAVIVSLLAMVTGAAVTDPPATTFGLAEYPHIAGTAARLLGLTRYAFGGLVRALVGLADSGTARP